MAKCKSVAEVAEFIRSIYPTNDIIPLHAPTFGEQEKTNVLATIDSTFVSSVGRYVDQFEQQIKAFTKTGRAVATVNGTAALHTALYASGVRTGDLVITQPLTFVATCNAIHQLGAEPAFVDVSGETLGLCPVSLNNFLEENCIIEGDQCVHKKTKKIIRAVVPMHTFGHPVHLDEISALCKTWHLTLVEDAAESLGSYYNGQHTGSFGRYGVLSFNGNKIITTGGGGMVLCANEQDGEHIKHITTTAKVPHAYEFYHDEPGFNYRMPNINAALGCGQMGKLDNFLASKRAVAGLYRDFFSASDYEFIDEPAHGQSNFWLNAVFCQDEQHKQQLLDGLIAQGIAARPVWQLMNELPVFASAISAKLDIANEMQKRLLCLPSSAWSAYEKNA